MHESLRINLLGAPSIGETDSVPLRLGKKPAALIALLSSPPGKRFRREEIASLLWEKRFEEQARQSLRQSLTAIRKKLGEPDLLCTEDGEIWLDPKKISTDVSAFEIAAAGDTLDALERAVELYKGDFIARLVSVSTEFDEWAALERTRLKNLAISCHEKLLTQLGQTKRGDHANALAQRLLTIDPSNETAHRALMASYAEGGRQAAALRQYKLCKSTLSYFDQATPEPATEALAEEIRRMEEQSSLLNFHDRAASAAVSLRKSIFAAPYLVAGAAFLAVLAGIAFLLFRPPESRQATNACGDFGPLARGEAPSLMVLPLNASFRDGAIDEFFPMVLQEAIRSALLLVDGVAIVEGPPSGHEDLLLNVKDVASKHGVTHVLKGSIRPFGDGGAIRLWLTEATTGRIIWETVNSFEIDTLDSARIQNQAIYEVTRAIQFHITDGPQASRYKSYEITDIEAFRLNTKAYSLINTFTPSNIELARDEYRRAMVVQPDDAGALNGYAMSYLIPVVIGWSANPQEDLATASQYANRLLGVNPEYPYLYSTLGLLALVGGDHENAANLARKAIQLSENNADGAIILAFILTFAGEPAQAVDLARKAISLRPYTTPSWQKWALARAMRLNGDPEGAAACLESAGATTIGLPLPSLEYIIALSQAGDITEARNAADMLKALAGEKEFTAGRYCNWPPHADPAVQAECVSALGRAGIPE